MNDSARAEVRRRARMRRGRVARSDGVEGRGGIEKGEMTIDKLPFSGLDLRKHTQKTIQIDEAYGGPEGLCQRLKTDPVNGLPNDPVELVRRRKLFGENKVSERASYLARNKKTISPISNPMVSSFCTFLIICRSMVIIHWHQHTLWSPMREWGYKFI